MTTDFPKDTGKQTSGKNTGAFTDFSDKFLSDEFSLVLGAKWEDNKLSELIEGRCNMAFIEYLLEKITDSTKFEELCTAVMLREGYVAINPTGGTDDKGRDAEERIFLAKDSSRTTLFQFSLEKNISSKVRKTLKRFNETGMKANEFIFVFSTRTKIGQRDKLREKALTNYGLNIDIHDQKFLAIRLGHPSYRDLTISFFSSELSDMKTLLESDELFTPDVGVPSKEQRCLVNIMCYARHPMVGDITEEIFRQAIRNVLARSSEVIDKKEILKRVFDFVPLKVMVSTGSVENQIGYLLQSGEILETPEGLKLSEDSKQELQISVAEIFTGRRFFYNSVFEEILCEYSTPSVNRNLLNKGIDSFLTNVFREYGSEVANSILDPSGVIESVLDQESINSILSTVTSQWDPRLGKYFREAMKKVFYGASEGSLQYLSALSRSYICIQLLNLDPNSINIQRKRLKESTTVLDTDVALTGIVDGSARQRTSKAIAEKSNILGSTCFVFNGSVEEIVYRIKRSINLYKDLGCPTFIPPNKRSYIRDIFLDIFFEYLAAGKTSSFDDFISTYYDEVDPYSRVLELIEDRLGVPVENLKNHYLIPQENKVERIKNTIEKSRSKNLSFKNPIMYERDALAMVTVEQQNRNLLSANKLGRWYLVSGDKHILNAYLNHKNSFKIKPSILPMYFIEILRQIPESGADEEMFGALLESEAMLQAVGKDYTQVIASMTLLGVNSLELPTERLNELIDVMDRADFTHWLIKLRNEDQLSDPIKEEIRDALQRMVEESTSRNQTIRRLEDIKKAK